MSKFMPVVVRERVEGAPGVVEEQEFEIYINKDQITLFNVGEDPKVTFVRLVCGATLCVLIPYNKFTKMIVDETTAKKPTTKKTTTKKTPARARKAKK